MRTSSPPADRIPVIVGIGEITDRPSEITDGLEPLTLLIEALKLAEADSGAALLGEIDSLDVVNFLSWRYRDPEKLLSSRLGIQPKHAYYGPVGGESPIRYLHEAAQRIARGECNVAAVCGAEAQGTATRAERAGITLPWTPFAHDVEEPKRGAAFQKPMAVKLGVFRPVSVYPFYEAAASAHWGQTPREAMAESGALWSAYSQAATENPSAWIKRRFTPEEITTPSADNRLIAWPYTKLMVANPTVNMGGALLVTSLAKARAAGIAEHKLVHIIGGASAEEPRDYLERDQFVESHAQNAVLEAVTDLAGGNAAAFDAIELYSCFPCVPKMARRTLGLGANVMPTVTGGLTFFGAPLNTYMNSCGLRDGTATARWRKARPALWPGRLCHQTPRAGIVAARAVGAASAGNQRPARGRPPPRPGAGFRNRGHRHDDGRKLHRDLWPRQRGRTRRGDAADVGQFTRAGAGPGRTTNPRASSEHGSQPGRLIGRDLPRADDGIKCGRPSNANGRAIPGRQER